MRKSSKFIMLLLTNIYRGYSVTSKLDDGLKKSGFIYLVILRVIVPFWMMNIVPSLFNVSLTTFSLATFVGLLPRIWVREAPTTFSGHQVYTEVGKSIGDAMVHIKSENDLGPVMMKVLMRRDMLISLGAFGILVIVLFYVKGRLEKANKTE